MPLTAQTVVAIHDRDSASYVAERDKFSALGFRTLSLSIYGTPAAPLYAAVMVKRPNAIETRSFPALSRVQLDQTRADMAKNGLHPYIITATGPVGGAQYAVAFRRMASTPVFNADMNLQQFADANLDAHKAGRVLLWADAFGSPADPHYCAVWANDPGRTAWNADAMDDGGAALQQRFDAMVSVGARPALIAATPAGRVFEMFVDTEIGAWTSRAGMTSADYQTEYDKQTKAGLWPVCVSATGSGPAARFAAIFATREEVSPRVFRSSALGSKIKPIDDAMQTFMQDHNMRGAALAIVQDTRLVYASGYTNAEASYPDILPSTAFRQASISKTYCAAAVWRLIAQGKLNLKDSMLDKLGLTKAQGVTLHTTPNHADWRYEDVTVGHLLESISGIDQGALYSSEVAATTAGSPLPSDGMEIANYVVTKLDLSGRPGDTNNVVYGNMDYLLLSQIVMKVQGAISFEAALKTLVLDPLGIKNTMGSRALIKDQPAGHARHHLTVNDQEKDHWWLYHLLCDRSIRSADRPITPYQYGAFDYETYDGCGGLSSSVVDVARLCAMLACRTGNPVIGSTDLTTWLDQAVAATKKNRSAEKDADGNLKRSHGYHGFDGASLVDAANHAYDVDKGGWLPGTGTYFTGRTGGLFFIGAGNGNTRVDTTTDWLAPVKAAATAPGVSWAGIDLFPTKLGGGTTTSPTKPITLQVPSLSKTAIGGMSRVAATMASVRASRVLPRRGG